MRILNEHLTFLNLPIYPSNGCLKKIDIFLIAVSSIWEDPLLNSSLKINILSFPTEILYKIIEDLSLPEMINLSCVSQIFFELVRMRYEKIYQNTLRNSLKVLKLDPAQALNWVKFPSVFSENLKILNITQQAFAYDLAPSYSVPGVLLYHSEQKMNIQLQGQMYLSRCIIYWNKDQMSLHNDKIYDHRTVYQFEVIKNTISTRENKIFKQFQLKSISFLKTEKRKGYLWSKLEVNLDTPHEDYQKILQVQLTSLVILYAQFNLCQLGSNFLENLKTKKMIFLTNRFGVILKEQNHNILHYKKSNWCSFEINNCKVLKTIFWESEFIPQSDLRVQCSFNEIFRGLVYSKTAELLNGSLGLNYIIQKINKT